MPVPTMAPTPIATRCGQLKVGVSRSWPSRPAMASMDFLRVMKLMRPSPRQAATYTNLPFAPALTSWGSRGALRTKGFDDMHMMLAGFGVAAMILAAVVPAQAADQSADARFKALYTREWAWREE